MLLVRSHALRHSPAARTGSRLRCPFKDSYVQGGGPRQIISVRENGVCAKLILASTTPVLP